MIENLNILITGGCGTFGKALARRRKHDGWMGRLTVFSTDTMKHERMRREYPDINFVQGDIRNGTTLYNAMCGHDIVIHAAAVKVIPASEYAGMDTIDVNINGSLNVCACAQSANTKHVIGISTDKACKPVNTYGATKMLMERVFQEYARLDFPTQFHLARFGNVLESNGSVIETWRKAIERGERIKLTDPNMTRFWLSPSQAVEYVIKALDCPSGCVYIPRMSALSLGKLAFYTCSKEQNENVSSLISERVPVRPGEKTNETLLTEEEGWYALQSPEAFLLAPTTSQRFTTAVPPYSSDMAPELTRDELLQLLAEG